MPLPSDAIQARHTAAIDAAKEAGHHLRTLFADRGRLVVEEKGANDFVSRADREAEAIVKAVVDSRFPQDGFVGEETGASAALGEAEAVWVVDPLDGTTNFLRGNPNWCVSIAVVVGEEPLIGVIYDPIRDELFDGLVGAGARLDGAPIHVTAVAAPGSATIGLGITARVGAERFAADAQALLGTGLSFRQVGAGALMLAYVAAGRVDSYFERHMWPWDALAGLALVRAAGGVHGPYPTGSRLLEGGAVLAGNPQLFEALQPLVG